MDSRRIRRNMALLGVVLAPVACVQAGSLQVIADTDTTMPVPGAPATFMNFGLLNGMDPSISGQNVVFGATDPTGIYALINGELISIANTETDFPDSDVQFRFSFSFGSIPGCRGAGGGREARPPGPAPPPGRRT